MKKVSREAIKKVAAKIRKKGMYNLCIEYRICPECGGHLFNPRWSLFHCNSCGADVYLDEGDEE